MDISVRSVAGPVIEDRSWLGDAAGTDETRSVTLVTALFTKATHFPAGVLKSGTWLGRVTSGPNTGLYGPYSDAATDGRQVCAGVLFNSLPMETGGPNHAAPMQERGYIIEANLPANHGLDAAGKVDLGSRFIYRDR